jgi:hypothetical protein
LNAAVAYYRVSIKQQHRSDLEIELPNRFEQSERSRAPIPTHRGQHSDDRGQSGEGLKSGPDRHPNQLIPPPQPRVGHAVIRHTATRLIWGRLLEQFHASCFRWFSQGLAVERKTMITGRPSDARISKRPKITITCISAMFSSRLTMIIFNCLLPDEISRAHLLARAMITARTD